MRSCKAEFHRATLITVMLGALLVSGCSSMGSRQNEPVLPDAEAISASEGRVKQVFVHQGRVANDLLERYQFAEGPEAQMDPVLVAAEARMTDSCTYLNQAAVSYLAGTEPGLRLKMRVYASVDECEAAADEVAALLEQYSQPIAISDSSR
mgnify:CR=1 FL=1